MTERGWGILAVAIAEMLCPKQQVDTDVSTQGDAVDERTEVSHDR